MIGYEEIHEYISTADRAQLDALATMLRNRYAHLKAASKYRAQAILNYNDIVVINNIHPGYYNGCEALIVSFSPRKTKAKVRILKSLASRPLVGEMITIPIQCLTKIEE